MPYRSDCLSLKKDEGGREYLHESILNKKKNGARCMHL